MPSVLTITQPRPTDSDSDKQILQKMCELLSRAQGLCGSIYIADTAAHSGSFCGLVVSETITIAAITLTSGHMTGLTAASTLAPGYYPMLFTSITLASGKCQAINY